VLIDTQHDEVRIEVLVVLRLTRGKNFTTVTATMTEQNKIMSVTVPVANSTTPSKTTTQQVDYPKTMTTTILWKLEQLDKIGQLHQQNVEDILMSEKLAMGHESTAQPWEIVQHNDGLYDKSSTPQPKEIVEQEEKPVSKSSLPTTHLITCLGVPYKRAYYNFKNNQKTSMKWQPVTPKPAAAMPQSGSSASTTPPNKTISIAGNKSTQQSIAGNTGSNTPKSNNSPGKGPVSIFKPQVPPIKAQKQKINERKDNNAKRFFLIKNSLN